jgi:hypothetical protein
VWSIPTTLASPHVDRWNDMIVQTVAVQTFLNHTQVHRFTDFTYEVGG